MRNVLLVSDIGSALDYYNKLGRFSDYGFVIMGQAKTRSELNDYADNNYIDLCIVEDGFSGMEYEAIDAVIRSSNPEAEIIAVTTSDSPLREKKVLSLGAFAYLHRPLAYATFDMILESVSKRLARTQRLISSLGENSGGNKYQTALKSVLLNGILVNPEQVVGSEKLLIDAGIVLDGESFCLILARSKNPAKDKEAMSEYFSDKCYEECFVRGNTVVAILSSENEKIEEIVREGAKKLSDVIDGEILFSKKYARLLDSAIAYSSLLSKLSTSGDEERFAEIRTERVKQLSEGLIEEIKTGEENLAERLSTAFSVRYGGLTPEEISSAMIKILAYCDEAAQKAPLVREKFYSRAATAFCSQEMVKNTVDFSVETSKTVTRSRVSASAAVASKCYEMICTGYGDKDLSVKVVAEKLDISQNYLSTLMKKYYGDTFVNLLTNVRMEKAKQQLIYSRKKVSEICEEVGFSDSHYFSYSFKKFYGISPLEMREKGGNND